MKELLPTLVILLTFSTAALTTGLDAEKPQASPENPAKFNLNINNTDLYNHSYTISLVSPKSSWIYYSRNVQIDAKTDKDLDITVSPVKDAIQQRYRFDLKIKEDTGDTAEETGFFHVKQPYNIQIISLEQSDENILPGKKLNTSIQIKNLENTPLRNYTVAATYRGETDAKSGTEILPGGERRFRYTFEVPQDASPEENTIFYRITSPETNRTAEQTFKVKETRNIEKKREVDDKLLVKTVMLSAENKGNSETETSLEAEIPSYLEPLTDFSNNPEKDESGSGIRYTWTETLEPGETISSSYTVNYWQPLLAITLLLVAVAAIKKVGGNVHLEKSAEREEGEIKVNLEITNNSDKNFEEVRLVEFIPDIAEVDRKFDMNQPETHKTDEGTRIEWKVENLKPGDQRIIQYKIKPRIQVEENVTLQPAVLKDMNGQKIAGSTSEEVRFNPDTS